MIYFEFAATLSKKYFSPSILENSGNSGIGGSVNRKWSSGTDEIANVVETSRASSLEDYRYRDGGVEAVEGVPEPRRELSK